MAPSSQPSKSPSHGKSPSSVKSSQAARLEAGSPLFALLLNSETKDEGEELLDYCFPPDDRELQRIARMKGIFIACCGVMRAAVGEEAAIFVFWAEDGSRRYKASMRRIERWIACIVLPGSVPDRTAQFFTEEAAGLIALRHGKLSSLQGHFRQLDRIFRALGSMWSESLQGGEEAGSCSSLLYASLGVVPRSFYAESWKAEVEQKVCEWEARWEATAQDGSLAQPEGFALFLGQSLMGTSLVDRTFEACLRLCVLEGVLDAERTTGPAAGRADGAGDVRCHSLFLQQDEAGTALLPSHQYSVLRHGPWLLFMLWRMATADGPAGGGGTPAAGLMEGVSPKTPAKALLRGSDPFGVDLCLELLESLTLPDPYAQKAAARSQYNTPRGGASGRDGWRSFALSCPSVFKPGSRRSRAAKQQQQLEADALPRRPVEQPFPAFCALELEEPGCTASSAGRSRAPMTFSAALEELARMSELTAPSFTAMQEPRGAAFERLSEASRLLCPEMSYRAVGHKSCEWLSWVPRELIYEWNELEWLARTHRQRRIDWREAPSPSLCRHALLSVFKNKGDFDRMWDECLEESSLAAPAKALRSEATHLGDGQPWRFQVGAPFHMSDVAPLISAGALTGSGHCRAWTAISTLSPGGEGGTQHVLLHLDDGADGSE